MFMVQGTRITSPDTPFKLPGEPLCAPLWYARALYATPRTTETLREEDWAKISPTRRGDPG